MSSAIILSGTLADYGELESSGSAKIKFADGPHIGHEADYITQKANCGAAWEKVSCSCGATYISAANGCWQSGHQWHADGDKTLSPNFPPWMKCDNTPVV